MNELDVSKELDDLIKMMQNAKPDISETKHSKKNLDKSDIKYLDVNSGYKPPKDIRSLFNVQ